MRALFDTWRLQVLPLLSFVLMIAAFFPTADAHARGYEARACGFDMDNDGLFGEPEDCQVCNGTSLDGDADGSGADVIYVSCEIDASPAHPAGNDDTACGSPANPCRTLEYALEQIADGPATGDEDFICFRNTCQEDNLSPRSGEGGQATTYLLPATGNQQRDWLLPADPLMIVGWDVDQDGIYPPLDADHSAVLIPPVTCPQDPNRPCLEHPIDNPDDNRQRYHQKEQERTFRLNNDVSHLELAHFTVRDYGRYTLTEDSGFLFLHYSDNGQSPSVASDYLYFHDIEIYDLNRDSNYNSRSSVINFFNWRAHYVAFENLKIANNGHWFVRGGGSNGPTEYGPFRWQNLSLTLDACKPPPENACDRLTDPDCASGNVCVAAPGECAPGELCLPDCEPGPGEACQSRTSTSWKVWGYYSGFEILDSVIDANVAAYDTFDLADFGRPRGIDMAQCTQDWAVRGNELIDMNSAIEIVPVSVGSCDGKVPSNGDPPTVSARPVENIVVDRNIIRHAAPPVVFDQAVLLKKGGSGFPGQVVGAVTLTNNVITANPGYESCIDVEAGHDYDGSIPGYPAEEVPGQITIVNNTCWGPITHGGAIEIGIAGGNNQLYRQQHLQIENNLVGGKSTAAANIALRYAPTDLQIGHNVWDEDGGFLWNDPGNSRLDFAAWSLASGDSGSAECRPLLLHTEGVYGNGDPAIVDGDARLDPTDTCARDRGVDTTAVTQVDLEGDARPQAAAWDIGADEVAVTPLDQPPLRFAGEPTGILPFGTTEVSVTLSTDQAAVCNSASVAGIAFGDAQRSAFGTTGGTTHSLVQSLTADTTYSFYVRCQNSNDVANPDDYLITFATAGLSTSLLAEWRFDEGAGCSAGDSGGLHPGALSPTCASGPTWQAGIAGQALSFDGVDDHVAVDYSSTLIPADSFTVSAWIRPWSFGQGRYGRVLSTQKYVGGFGSGLSLYVADQPGGNPAATRAVCANIGTTAIGCSDDDVVELGAWQHLALVYDSELDEARFYIDSQDRGSFAAAQPPGDGGVDLQIGNRDDLNRAFDGSIDEVRLYGRALASSEISVLAAAAPQPPKRFGTSPQEPLAAGTQIVQAEISTHEPATCRYATTAATAYAAMDPANEMTADSAGLHHTASLDLGPFADGRLHRYYIRCLDDDGNANLDDQLLDIYVGFHPSDLGSVELFVESRSGLGTTFGSNSADTPSYCDRAVFPDGCIRRWIDQSGTISNVNAHISGRDFGQDDKEKPGRIDNCLNGYPCARGGSQSLSSNFQQDIGFEIEIPDAIDSGLDAGVSLFLLARPIAQVSSEGDTRFAYFGYSGTVLFHDLSDDSLYLQIAGVEQQVTAAGAVELGSFQLIEIHRAAGDNSVRIFIDGVDVTLGQPIFAGDFRFRFLLSAARNWFMYGDVAALLITDQELSASETANVRQYLNTMYRYDDSLPTPVARWSFEEGTGCTTSDDIGGRVGTLADCPSGGPTWTTGYAANGLDFDTYIERVDAAHDATLDFDGPFTISAWIYPRSFGRNNYGRIVAKQQYVGGFAGGYSFYLGNQSPGTPAGVETLCANIGLSDFGCGDANSIVLDAWQHAVMVFDDAGDVVRFYVDGQPRGAFAVPGTPGGTSVPLRIGNRDDLQRHFDGTIDEVLLFDRALTAAEVAELYAGYPAP